MADSKMLQILIDGQALIHKDLKRVEKNLSEEIKKNGKRLDVIDISVARLEDDTPTVEEFDDLGKRVGKLEKQVASN